MGKPKKSRHLKVHGVIILVACLLTLLSLKPEFTVHLEDPTIAIAANVAAHFAEPPELLLITVDETTQEMLGKPPWPRGKILRALEQLELMQPKLIAIDADLIDTKAYGLDSRPKSSKQDNRPLLRGYRFMTSRAEFPEDARDQAKQEKAIDLAAEELALPSTSMDLSRVPAMAGIPFDAVSGSLARTSQDGFSNLFPDADGILRHHALMVRLGDRLFPSLALAAASAAKGFTPIVTKGRGEKPNGIALGEMTIKTPADLGMRIWFQTLPGSLETVSMAEVLSGAIDVAKVVNRIVFVSATEPFSLTSYPTPVGRMSTAELSALLIDAVFHGNFLKPLHIFPWASLAVIFAALRMLLLLRWKKTHRIIAMAIVSITAAWLLTIILYAWIGVLLPCMHFTLALIVLLCFTLFWRWRVITLPQRHRRETFSARTSPSELEQTLDQGLLDMPYRTSQITGLSLDLKGFAAIAEQLSPEKLFSFCHEYRRLITAALLKQHAFIESFSGDECRAAFGSLTKRSGHGVAACRAALDIARTLHAGRETFASSSGISRLVMNIGIASGTAAIGNVGSHDRQLFSVLGQAMETAHLLRALCRTYRIQMLVNQALQEETQRLFLFRPLDPILLPGRDEPETLFELVGETGIIFPLLNPYLEARTAYLDGDFERAEALFLKITRSYPQDGPSRLFLKRTQSLRRSPPKQGWKGLWGNRNLNA